MEDQKFGQIFLVPKSIRMGKPSTGKYGVVARCCHEIYQNLRKQSKLHKILFCKCIIRCDFPTVYDETNNSYIKKRHFAYLGSQPSTSAIPTNDNRNGDPTFDA